MQMINCNLLELACEFIKQKNILRNVIYFQTCNPRPCSGHISATKNPPGSSPKGFALCTKALYRYDPQASHASGLSSEQAIWAKASSLSATTAVSTFGCFR